MSEGPPVSSHAMPPAPFRHSWDTLSVSRQDRFAYFREGVCQAAFAITPEQVDGRAIDARMERADLSKGFISKVDMSPHRALRTKTDLANIPEEFFALMLQTSGGSRQVRDGEVYFERPAEAHLVNCNQIVEFEIESKSRYAATILVFNKSALTSQVKSSNHPGRNYTGLAGSSAVAIKSCLQLITDCYNSASQLELSHLFDASLSLPLAGFINDEDYLEDHCAKDIAVSTGILQTIKTYVGKTIADPALSTLTVAGHFGISPRYVQKLFASDGTTFKSFVNNARLDCVQTDLCNRSIAHVPAGEVAFRWGFRDMTTFHRNFKRRFGDTPGQVRTLMTMKAENGILRETR